MSALDLDHARETFDSSTDFTIGLEEEFAILDPATLELEHRFEDVYAACQEDEVLAESAAGELIASEVEIRSGRGRDLRRRGRRPAATAATASSASSRGMGLALGATGTHPWASYLDQRIIDTPHYNRLREELGYVAQRNNTWSLHVHVGVRGADRAIAVCDWMRELLPLAARRLRQLALPRPPRHRPAHGPHRDLHPHLPALRRAQPFRRLGHLRRLRRHARADRHGGRVDPALVERAPAPRLRHGRGADLRRPDARRGGASRWPA